MIGTNQIAKVLGKTFSKVNPEESNGVIVMLPSGEKGILHISRMIGKTPEDRANTLMNLTEGSPVEVDVVSQTIVDGEPGFRVNQWSVLRRARKEAACALVTSQEVLTGTIERKDENFAIVKVNLTENPQDELQGLLHVSRMLGDSDEEKAAAFEKLDLGQTISVSVSEVLEVQGRLRVRLGQISA